MSKQHRKQKPEAARFQVENRLERPESDRRVITNTFVDTAATGTGLLVSTGSLNITSCQEWTNMAALWQEYRIRGVKATCVPRRIADTGGLNIITAGDISDYPGALISYVTVGNITPATVTQAMAFSQSKVHRSWDVSTQQASWEANPSAKLWTPTNTAPAALSSYSVEFRGTVSALAAINGLATHDVFIWFDVEFRGRTI